MRIHTVFSNSRRFSIPVASALLALLVFGAYLPVHHAHFVWDDYSYLIENPHVRTGLTLGNIRWAFFSFYSANWHPLTWISHQLDVTLFGLLPGGHHLVNLVLHCLNAIVLLIVLVRLTRAPRASLFVAALFALHPLNVETVAWVAERKSLLCMLFSLASLGAYRSYARNRSWVSYAGCLLLFACALMCKAMAVTLPALFLLLDFWPLRRLEGKTARQLAGIVFEKSPLFILSAASCAVTLAAQQFSGAVAPLERVHLGIRFANASISYVSYLGNVFWPAALSVFYPLPDSVSWWRTAGAVAVLVPVTVFSIMSWKKWPWILVGWFWFLGTMVPVIGIVQVGSQAMADRYMYMPMIGIFIIVSQACRIIARLGRVAGVAVPVIAAVAAGGCANFKIKDTIALSTPSQTKTVDQAPAPARARPRTIDREIGMDI